ncbi:uncharacterized protein LOC130691854 [Daphnia carinata]|uniref:uncharacterized protein LOC130691854 n=1 Tax=Daphnia carinata TaxID=120202 RepID=UPI00257E7420|nr:uncharacterized protein LOC130691854 [Daphnia carinata]
MNLVIHMTLAVIFAIHSADSSVWTVRRDVSNPSASSHRVARRASLPYWLRELRNGGRLNSAGIMRKNRHTEDIFVDGDAAVDVALEPYIQQASNTGNVMEPNTEDDMIFGAANGDKVVVKEADAMEGAPAIDFGVQDRMKNRFPHHGRRPGCNKTESVGASEADRSAMADVSSSLDSINQPVWTPVVNESQCQSYGSSQFCEDVTNYPAEAIKEILMSDNGSLLTTFFADNIQPLASSSQPDESMILAQRKPDLSTAVTSHAINTRIKPLATSATDILPLCDSKTDFLFPKSARSKDNEMLMIVNQDNISQPITVETCRGENKPCHHAENFPAGFKAVCMQKFVTHHLAAIKNGKIVREAFTFPSCCVCVLRQPFLDSRSNIPSSISRRAIMPSAQQRMAAEIDGHRWQ